MKRHLLWYFLLLIGIYACSDESSSIPAPETHEDFYTVAREVIYSLEFDDGMVVEETDSANYIVVNAMAYEQVGPCAEVEHGYMNLGCVMPLRYLDSQLFYERIYELAEVDTVFHFFKKFNFLNDQELEEVSFQIDFHRGGDVEFHLGKYHLTSDLLPYELDEKSLHIQINQSTGQYRVVLEREDISDRFQIAEHDEPKNFVSFKVKNAVEISNGVQMINKNGMRIDGLEIYATR